jgi:drug/metabolite transporter (DMT)-like permease
MGLAYIFFFKSAKISSFSIASVMQSFIPVFTLLTVHFTEGIAISPFSISMIIIASFGASISVLSIREH